MADPVGTREICQRTGASRKTIWKWRDAGIFPDPEYPSVNNEPAWEFKTVLRWMGDGQRLHDVEARAEYKRLFRREAPPYRAGGAITERVAKVNAATAAKKAARVAS